MATSRGSPLAYNGPNYDSGSTRASRYSTRLFQTQQAPKCTLELEEVVGNTVNNSNGVDSLINGTFAVCSGSTAVVNNISPDRTTKQRVFRAPPVKPTKEIISNTDSAPNSPSRPKGRQTRASILPAGFNASDINESPSKTAVHKKPKGTSCLALSPNGLFLAVGETGYAPRILLFLLKSTANTPISIATEHGSGIQTLCFSPDSKWLCSVGDIYDGCIHLWQITPKNLLKLSASSRCTSIVHQTKWVDDRSIVTAGVRHLKIWRPEIPDQAPSPTKSGVTLKTRTRQESPVPASPSLRSLPGRNVLLNSLLESTFTSLCPVRDSKAIVGSDSGDLSIFSVNKGTQELRSIINLGAPIKCATLNDARGVILVATDMDIWIGNLPDPKSESTWDASHFIKGYHLVTSPLAIGFITDHQILCIDNRRRTSVYQLQVDQQNHRFNLQYKITHPTHSAAVNGSVLRTGNSKPSLLTYDASGHMVIWGSNTTELDFTPLASFSTHGEDSNELRVMKQIVGTNSTICGDKFGSLTVFDSDWCLCHRVQAHSSDMNDVAIIELQDFETMVVTCGRDRIVQVFAMSDMELVLLQTLDQHNGSVNKLEVMAQNTTLLLSLSSDRTIAIHALGKLDTSQAFLCIRTITFKSTPLSCAFDATNPGNLIVTTADKHLQTIQLSSGLLESSTKIIDEDDHIAMQHMQVCSINEKSVTLLIGISNADKALRVHNAHNGEMICKAGGHSEGITSLTIIDEDKQNDGSKMMQIVTTSLDGTVMFWKLCCHNPLDFDEMDMKDAASPQETRPSPLRKVLSKTQLAGFAAALDLGEWSPLPSPTREYPSLRKSSPDRLRRRASLANLLNRDSPTPVLSPTPRQTRALSPIITTPSTLLNTTVGPEMLTGPGPITMASNPSITTLSDNLVGMLRRFRTSLRGISNDIDNHARHELKLELEMTLDVLSQQTANDSGQDDVSYFSAINGIRSMSIAEE